MSPTALGIAACALALVVVPPCASAQNRAPYPGAATPLDLAAALPDTTVAVLDWRDGAAVVTRIRGLVRDLRDLHPALGLGLGLLDPLVRGATGGLDLEEVAAAVAPHQAVVALIQDGPRTVPIYVARVPGPSSALDRLLARVRQPAVATVDDGLLVAAPTAAALARFAAFRAGGGRRLADRAGFAERRPAFGGETVARLWVDVKALRAARDDGGLWMSLDAGGRFLLGPVAALLDRAERFDGVLTIGPDGVRFAGALDASADLDGVARHVVALGLEPRVLPPAPDGTIATVSLDRSLGGFWAHLDEVVSESDAVQARSFLSIADALLRASFVDDLLPSLAEPLTLFVVRSDDPNGVAEADTVPPIDLPSFVLVSPMRTDSARKLLERAWRAIMLVSAPERRREDKPVFALRRRTDQEDRVLWVAEPDEWRGPGAGPIDSWLTPTLAFESGHAVIASTRDGAERALRALALGTGATIAGDLIEVVPGGVAEYVARNVDLLALDAVLKDGKTPARARADLDMFTSILDAFQTVGVTLVPGEDGTAFTLEAEVRR